ncbi:MAG: coenzyme F420-0:L-glutamate ligase [Candidatus Bathyarchaeota archaeon]|nr:coenzyme F420-0:L-glutamate ligase [Candidatus Bathyarchaeota archaeon]
MAYWKPKTDYALEIARAVSGRVEDGDFVVVSEKALSTARGNLVDESVFEAGFTARVLANFWMPYVWGGCLGVVCRLGQRLRRRLQQYPREGAAHKQVSLEYAGFWQALLFGSEGAIDGSNLPYAYVCLPLNNPKAIAQEIQKQIHTTTHKNVAVLIVDTDKTYTFKNYHFTPRPNPLVGIHSHGAVFAYVVGRFFKLRRRPTPLAVAGASLAASQALTIANVADHASGPGSGATVWDMAARFKVAPTAVTWDMLAQIHHKPVVLVRRARKFCSV